MGMHVFYCVFMLLLCHDTVSSLTINSQTSTDVDSVLGLLLKENEILRNRIERLEAERKQLENRVDMIEELTNQNSELPVRPDGNSDILKLVNGTVTSSVRSDSTVAFYAYASRDRCYNNRETIIFDREMLDVHQAYNTNSGIFVVPVTGIYVFSWTVAARHDNWFFTELVVNNIVAGRVMTDADVGGRAQGIHPATGVAVLMVDAKSHVFVRFHKGHNCVLMSGDLVMSTFSGWLLHRS